MEPGSQWLLAALLCGAAVLGAGYLLGRRINRRIALRVARELEQALEPTETLYTWIGGLIGFHARYQVRGLAQVKITCTLLPRQAISFLPVSLLLGRGDRLHVTLYVEHGFQDESHLVARRALLSPLMHIHGRERMHEQERICGDHRFLLLSTSEQGLRRMDGVLQRLHREGVSSRLRHLAVVPDLSTVYVQVVPAEGIARRTSLLLMEDVGSLTGPALAQESGDDMGGMQKVPDTPGTDEQE